MSTELLTQESTTFSLPWATLSIHILVEGRSRRIDNIVDIKQNFIFLKLAIARKRTVVVFLHTTKFI